MITVLSGSNRYALQQELTKLKEDFVAQYGQAGIETYNGEQVSPEMLTGLVGGATLFSTQRLIIIKDLSQEKLLAEQLVSLADNIPAEVRLVLVESQLDKRTVFYKSLKKLGEVQEFSEPDEGELLKWISSYVRQVGGSSTPAVSRMLYEYVGSNQLALSNEITKLVAYQSEVTADTVAQLVVKSPRETTFQLLDAVLSGKQSQALEILMSLEKNFEDPFQIVNMLIWQTQVAAVIFSATNKTDSEIAKLAQLNPYVVRKTRTLINRLNRSKLNQIVDRVAELDIRLKSSNIPPWRALEQTVLSL